MKGRSAPPEHRHFRRAEGSKLVAAAAPVITEGDVSGAGTDGTYYGH